MDIYIYGALLMAFCALAFISRGEKEKGILSRIAAFLARVLLKLRRKTPFSFFAGGESVQSDLATLYPSGRLRGQEEKFTAERIRLVLMILLAGDILAIASYAASDRNLLLADGRLLHREEVGGEDREAELVLYAAQDSTSGGEADEKELGNEWRVPVRAQKLSRGEVDRMADKLLKALPAQILGENEDLAHVHTDLVLPPQADGYPFRITWESSSYAMVDADGTVGNAGLRGEEAQKVVLTPVLTYEYGAAGELRYEGEIELTVLPRRQTKEEAFLAKVQGAIRDADEESVSSEWLKLPDRLEGRRLIWKEKSAGTAGAILLAALIAAAIAFVMRGTRLHEKVRLRSRQMALDYPAIVSKFVLYLGAGLSVRNVFCKLGEDYQKQRAEGKEERGAYEEILLVTRELQGGISEQEAYAHLRQRCRSVQYTRLCTLLSQNLRMGNRELLEALQEEARASFEERRNTARELGEEAETKLLMPMILMLAITMVIIIVPAYYSFAM